MRTVRVSARANSMVKNNRLTYACGFGACGLGTCPMTGEEYQKYLMELKEKGLRPYVEPRQERAPGSPIP